MCTVSQIADGWTLRNPQYHQWVTPEPVTSTITYIHDGPTRAEFEALKQELQELKVLLLAAKRYDEATGQKDCEDVDKVAIFKKLAKLVEVDFDEVFRK
jgi:hypothetical protein